MDTRRETAPVYMATVVAGLEDIALQEMYEKFPSLEMTDRMRGKIFFSYREPYKELFALKCVDNLYLYIGSFPIGPHKVDLAKIPEKIRDLPIKEKMLQVHWNRGRKIIVSASRSGKHTYSRFDIAKAVLDALINQFAYEEGTTERHDVAFRIDVEGDRAFFYCKLTPASFRFRGKDKEFLSGALKPSVAHAMVLISEPVSTDVFLDPFCGSGTIPFERAFYDAFSIMASDLSSERLEAARMNLPDHVGINCWDACHTELSDYSVTKIVSNLPWGKQIKVDDIHRLYNDFLKEANRILIKEGKIVLLTDEEDALKSAASANDLKLEKICTLSLHGLHPSIFLLQKSNA